jgi:hypothetical protein
MSARWFRFYADAMRHPKVAALPDPLFRLWVDLLCVAAENEGHIPPAEALKHMLKRRLDHLLRGLKDLISAGLIDPLEDGYEPHDWKKRQYKSDVSTSRVRKFRKKGNVSETPPDTETETDNTEEDKSSSGQQADFGFTGSTIRLNRRDYRRWAESYHAIPDLKAELNALDDWLQGPGIEKRDRWFHAVSGALSRKHQEILKAAKEGASEGSFTGFC